VKTTKSKVAIPMHYSRASGGDAPEIRPRCGAKAQMVLLGQA